MAIFSWNVMPVKLLWKELIKKTRSVYFLSEKTGKVLHTGPELEASWRNSGSSTSVVAVLHLKGALLNIWVNKEKLFLHSACISSLICKAYFTKSLKPTSFPYMFIWKNYNIFLPLLAHVCIFRQELICMHRFNITTGEHVIPPNVKKRAIVLKYVRITQNLGTWTEKNECAVTNIIHFAVYIILY